MATIDLSTKGTLLDIQKTYAPQGGTLKMAEILARHADIIKDAKWEECNNGSHHTFSVQTGLGNVGYGRLNQAWGSTKGESRQVEAKASQYIADSRIDARLIDQNPEAGPTTRNNSDKSIVEGLGQKMASDAIYGNPAVNPDQPKGFATMYNALALPNVLSNGATTGTDLRSIWIVEWDVDKARFLYPKGTKGGIEMLDEGLQSISYLESGVETRMKQYITNFKAHLGIAVSDDRAVQRLCNIAPSGDHILKPNLLVQAINNLPSMGKGAVIYVDRGLYTQLCNLEMNKNNVQFTPDNAWGGMVLSFRGLPVRMIEQLADETVVA